MHLIFAVDHPHQRDILAVVEFGVARGTPFLDLLLEAETAFVATDDSRQTEFIRQVGDMLEHTVQLDVVVGFLLHNSIKFLITQKTFA